MYFSKVELLVVFCKNPKAVAVKTRLAASIGTQTAEAIYQKLCEHTQNTVLQWGGQVAVFHHPSISYPNPWEGLGKEQHLQQGLDLGERMAQAFQWGFQQGYSKIVIIGTDLWSLQRQDLDAAFDALADHDVVWGPAQDGGYYLLGLSAPQPDLFVDLPWSQSDLLEQSQKRIRGTKQFSLRWQNDIDILTDLWEEKDLVELFKTHLPKN